MREVSEEQVSKVVGKIYRDSKVAQSKTYFIELKYKASQFKSMIDEESFHSIIGFLPNTKYRGQPFIMSVVYNKRNKDYEITVHNPKLKY